MKKIELILVNPKNLDKRISLFFKLDATPIAEKYFLCLSRALESGITILDAERFYNFPNDFRDSNWIGKELNKAIGTINEHSPGEIPDRAEDDMSQGMMNILHHHFERLRGSILRPSPFFNSAPRAVKLAIEELNLLIHRYEDFQKNQLAMKLRGRPNARAVLTFDPRRPRYKLAGEDYPFFDRRTIFGAWMINYCEVGKPIWDVYQDKDEIVGDDNIKPLRFYSADAYIQFSPTSSVEAHNRQMNDFYKWWDSKSTLLQKLGFEKFDKLNAIGNITVAQLDQSKGDISGMTEEQIVQLVSEHQRFFEVKLHGVIKNKPMERISNFIRNGLSLR